LKISPKNPPFILYLCVFIVSQILRKRELIQTFFKKLANLSLQDYYWRSDYFKKSEADRQVEESIARMMGEEAAYVRPMDAGDGTIGPLVSNRKFRS